jgi:SAM-dependent methyltransferase
MLDFKDNFSLQSDIYSRYRPSYPDELFTYLASLTPGHKLAWDCGTGNGQAASSLVNYYDEVIATEPSEAQIRNAIPHPRIQYKVEVAERSSLRERSADLVTIANAMHWFKLDEFYTEVRRVLKPGGVIAAWCYQVPSVNNEVDKILMDYHDVTLGSFWKEPNRLVDLEYTTIPFPFQDVKDNVFYTTRMFTLEDLIIYLNTWSATQRFIGDRGTNPTEALVQPLAEVWENAEEQRKVTWKLIMKTGVVN